MGLRFRVKFAPVMDVCQIAQLQLSSPSLRSQVPDLLLCEFAQEEQNSLHLQIIHRRNICIIIIKNYEIAYYRKTNCEMKVTYQY